MESWPKNDGYYNNENNFTKSEMGPRTGCGNPKNCGEDECPAGKEPMFWNKLSSKCKYAPLPQLTVSGVCGASGPVVR